MSHANSQYPTLPDDTNSRPNWRDVIEDVVAADFNALESMLRTLQGRAGNDTYGGGPSDFFAYPHPSGGLRLRLNPGTLITAAGLVAWIAQQDTTTLTAPVTNPRIDVAALDTTTGAVSWVAGTEAASPAVPTVPAGKAAAWAVYLRVGATAIDRFAVDIGTNSYLYRDLRRAIGAGGGGGTGGAPALTLGTANTDGTSGLFIETNAALALFDATVPVTQAYSDAAAAGSAAVAARRDHRHGMPASGGGSGALTLIDDQTLGADAAQITFSSIAGTYKHLRIIFQARGTSAAGVVAFRAQFNADTAANYDTIFLVASGSGANTTATPGGGRTDGAAPTTSLYVAQLPDSTSPAGSAGAGDLLIPNYAGTVFHKQTRSVDYGRTGTSAQSVGDYGGTWRSTAAITAIRLFPLSGNLLAGSRASLYGLS